MDLSRMYEFDWSPVLPVAVPRDWPFAPLHAPAQGAYYNCVFKQQGQTSLDTYVAPRVNMGSQYYTAYGSVGNGKTFTGNAPTAGIYTGVQQE